MSRTAESPEASNASANNAEESRHDPERARGPSETGGRFPARVTRAIERQREQGEIVVSWIQAAVIALLGGLYFIAPKTAPMDAALQPVPWALGIYAAFTAYRLYRSHARSMNLSLCAASILIDIGVLALAIWSFHIQYGQPAAFYLKAPTFTYFFIFIALRTLTLQPSHVVLAGISATIGWLSLLAYAMLGPGSEGVVTHDYVTYMTSARVLVGGEIDKVISLLVVTGLLAYGAARGRDLLERALIEQAAVSQLARFFSPEIAQTLSRADELLQPGEGETREAAAMFVDLRGFTRLAEELEPRVLVALLAEYRDIVVKTVHANAGSITTFLGDGVMATFGAIQPGARSAADALRCADALVEHLGEWSARRAKEGKPAPGFGIGIDAGPVTCGAIGAAGRLEYAVVGDPVNKASKLQNHTKFLNAVALTSASTFDKARRQGYSATRNPTVLNEQVVAGIGQPMSVAILAIAH